MEQVSRRDYFAATANVDWIKNVKAGIVAKICEVTEPPTSNPTDANMAMFYIKAEIKWRWKYADMMIKGEGDGF